MHMIPFQYHKQFDHTFLQLGHVPQWDTIHIDGSLQDNDFIAYFGYNNHVT